VEPMQPTVPSPALFALLRIYLGAIFLFAAVPKWTRGHFATSMGHFLQAMTPNAIPSYQDFVAHVVLPHAAGFATAIASGEVIVGVLLVTGTATRLAAVGAMFLLLNYMLAKGMWFWTPASNDSALFFIALVVALGAAGRTAGFDRYLARRWPGVPIW
jgi:thiosulfate dehydrogenase [quinone] large subunit